MPAPPTPHLTDSPWLWAYLFSMMALLALFVMAPKYTHRQTHIEDEYRFGTRTVHKPDDTTGGGSASAEPAALAEAPPATAAEETAPIESGPQPATHKMIISLQPLWILVGAAALVSFAGLQWTLFKQRKDRMSNVE